MKQAVYFETEADFREWFEQHLPEFGIRKIIVNQEVCPDYVVTMETGETKRIEAELFAINFKYHRHKPEKVDLIIACYANQQEIEGIPVIAVNRFWEYRPNSPNVPLPDGSLSDDELRMLNNIQFFGGIELSALGQGDFAGNSSIYLSFTPDMLSKWPRGKVEDTIFGVISPKAKKFIKKYHYAVIGGNLSERACTAFDSLNRRRLIKTQPISWIAAAYDGVILTHPGWIPTEVCATEMAKPFLKFPF